MFFITFCMFFDRSETVMTTAILYLIEQMNAQTKGKTILKHPICQSNLHKYALVTHITIVNHRKKTIFQLSY